MCARIADVSDGRWELQRKDIYKIEARFNQKVCK